MRKYLTKKRKSLVKYYWEPTEIGWIDHEIHQEMVKIGAELRQRGIDDAAHLVGWDWGGKFEPVFCKQVITKNKGELIINMIPDSGAP